MVATTSTFCLDIVRVGLVLGLEFEVGMRRAQEHLAIEGLAQESYGPTGCVLPQLDPVFVVLAGHQRF